MLIIAQETTGISLGNFLTVLGCLSTLLTISLGAVIGLLYNIKASVSVLISGAATTATEMVKCQDREKTSVEALWSAVKSTETRVSELEKHGSPLVAQAITTVHDVESRIRELEKHGAEPVRERMGSFEMRLANLERYSIRGSGESRYPEDERG